MVTTILIRLVDNIRDGAKFSSSPVQYGTVVEAKAARSPVFEGKTYFFTLVV
jgi:hypothetical protein